MIEIEFLSFLLCGAFYVQHVLNDMEISSSML